MMLPEQRGEVIRATLPVALRVFYQIFPNRDNSREGLKLSKGRAFSFWGLRFASRREAGPPRSGVAKPGKNLTFSKTSSHFATRLPRRLKARRGKNPRIGPLAVRKEGDRPGYPEFV
jgi:hypothetical protein